MRIAFYAPLKPPDSSTPSGDRRVARLFLDAFRHAGHDPVLASRLRSRDGAGDERRQERLRRLGARLAERILRRIASGHLPRPDLWFTYHLYYKAPDWIGPRVASALSIPYVVAEASHAPKRAGGRWDIGHRAVPQALARADLVIGLNRRDRECLEPLLGPDTRHETIRPFLATADLVAATGQREAMRAQLGVAGGDRLLLAVGMMRADVKLKSYRMLAGALAPLAAQSGWRLAIVGDGPARPEVEAAFAPLAARVAYTGTVDAEAIRACYAAADLMVWPAIDEAYGMALLEAQSAGLPVVAGDYGGVPDIIRDGETGVLTAPGDIQGFRRVIADLMADPDRLVGMAAAARRVTAAEHDIAPAAARIDALLREAADRYAGKATA